MNWPSWLRNQWPQLFLAGLMVIGAFIPSSAFTILPWAELQGEFWRLLTGHLVHTNSAHLLLNLTGFGLICLAFPDRLHWRNRCLMWLVLFVSVGLALSLFDPIEYYGFSGVLHGYLAFVLISFWRRQPVIHGVALLGLAVKIIFEQLNPESTTSTTAAMIAAPVAIQAHLYGVIAGAVCSLLQLAWQNASGQGPSGKQQNHTTA